MGNIGRKSSYFKEYLFKDNKFETNYGAVENKKVHSKQVIFKWL